MNKAIEFLLNKAIIDESKHIAIDALGMIKDMIKNKYVCHNSILVSTRSGFDIRTYYEKITRFIISKNKKLEHYTTRLGMLPQRVLREGAYIIKLDSKTLMYIKITSNFDRDEGLSAYRMDYYILGDNREYFYNKLLDIATRLSDKYLNIHSTIDLNSVLRRSFDNIFVKDKKLVINYLDNWRNMKEIFNSRGITYKGGILLYGKPGVGKTSLLKAIATYLNFDISICDFNSMRGIQYCYESNRVIAFEDIDTIVTLNRDNSSHEDIKEYRILNETLNLIDGLCSPSSCMFVATTNDISKLDPALIRDGRFDLKFEVQELDRDLAIEMVKSFNAPLSILSGETYPLNQSYLQGKILKHLNTIYTK